MQISGEIQSTHDVIEAVKVAALSFELHTAWWRGQGHKDWPLLPGIYRRPGVYRREKNINARFLHRAPARHPKCPEQGDWSSWLFFMQHYRLPTRLLDWTESALIATLFAVSTTVNEAGALWALCPTRLNLSQIGVAGILTPGHAEARDLFLPAFKESAPEVDKTLALVTNEVDFRMLVQLSTFTIHGTPEPLEKLSNSEKLLLKFEIPAGRKSSLKEELFHLGIRESNLFPDLEHLARELSSWDFKSEQ